MTEVDRIFADISVLLDYCLVYNDGQESANVVFEEISDRGGSIVASEDAYADLNEMISNRQRLFKHLVDSCTEYMNDRELTAADYKNDVLNYTSINQTVDFDVDESLLPDIQSLHDYFDEVGLSDFRNEVDRFMRQGSIQRRQLRKRFFADKGLYSKGGQSATMLRITISGIAEYEAQEVSLVDAAFWCQTQGNQILIRHGSSPHEKRDKLLSAVEEITTGPVSAYSPEEIEERI
ncbi:hypothetical protein J2744_000543 [Halorubrum trapanicum]|uniref:Uncharacterized protein n=1 Tax=Halorubrum trapanicum TaxID=29284 RepID=A0A8J7UMP8_9EURY|nr:hypothetical protein [Halorubrum trapanicum]MBP1900885.1 hypothetical protein [Halorubrum trapanicum]